MSFLFKIPTVSSRYIDGTCTHIGLLTAISVNVLSRWAVLNTKLRGPLGIPAHPSFKTYQRSGDLWTAKENISENNHRSFGSRKWWQALHNHHDALQLDKAKAVWFAETMTSRSRVHEVQAQRLFADVHCTCLFATCPYIFNVSLHLQPIAIASRHVVDSCWLVFEHL